MVSVGAAGNATTGADRRALPYGTRYLRMEHWVVGIDVGGTFTDLVASAPDGRIWKAKTPSTPDQSVGVLTGLARLAHHVGSRPPLAAGGVAADRAWHHGRDQRAAGGQGCQGRPDHDARVPRRNRIPALLQGECIRPAAQAAACDRAAALPDRRCRARGRGMAGARTARRGRGAGGARVVHRRGRGSGCRWLPVSFVNPAHERRVCDIGGRNNAGRLPLAVLRRAAGIREFERVSTTVVKPLSAARTTTCAISTSGCAHRVSGASFSSWCSRTAVCRARPKRGSSPATRCSRGRRAGHGGLVHRRDRRPPEPDHRRHGPPATTSH